ncbi:MAG: hypothetical protein AB1450_09535 [Pseudomonadota bacterium]
MSITDKISVNAHYTRSINLERDADSAAVVGAYLPTSRALKTLERLVETYKVEQAPRAWSLVGPYGSGKSSFAIFLAHLLASQDDEASKISLSVLRKADAGLARKYQNLSRNSQGHCYVLLTGSPEPLSKRLISALADSATNYWANRRGRNPAIIDELQRLSRAKSVNTSEILDAVRGLQSAIAKSGGNGLLIVIDELGKFLEYEARHFGSNDIFLLQALAEHACAGHDANLTLVVMLHQAFEQYAKGLGEALRNEWAKVQGRFENVPFLESTEQVLRIVGAAFEHNLSAAEQGRIKKTAVQAAKLLASEKALPGALDKEGAAELFGQCYPLHPTTALLLPMLCQKVAQNERTLFSYLGSQEPHGFKDSLGRLEKAGDWIYPWEIYEYFILNQPAAISDHFTHRRWAEVVTALERLGDAPADEIALLKAVGLLNIIGAQGGFKASKNVVQLCLPETSNAAQVINGLTKKSIIQYRKFSNEYRVWQGSDFDLDAAVEAQKSKQDNSEFAQIMNSRHVLMPIVARKYTIQSGALRYFVPTFVDAKTFKSAPTSAGEPRIIFFLSEGQEDRKLFNEIVKVRFSDLDIVVEYLNTAQLKEAVSEVLALEGVRREGQELNSDPVAQREFKDRYSSALAVEAEQLTEFVDNPTAGVWYWRGDKLDVPTKRAMQEAFSHVLGEVYRNSPVIHNELINRDKPSSQAAAGRNKLLAAMLANADQPDLGIEKYPPEKTIYRAVLRELGIHKEIRKGAWAFVAPSKDSSLHSVWQRIEGFLATTESKPRSFSELDAELMAPPFGVKEGVLPLLYFAVFLVNQHELALYENGVYSPYFTEEQLERFVKVGNEFTVQRFRIEGMRASIYEQYSRALFNDGTNKTIIELVRPLAKFIGELEEYTRKTKGSDLSARARAVRSAFNLAKSPERLLFEDLPEALGYDVKALSDGKQSNIEDFAKVLMDTLRELKYAYSHLLEQQQRLLAQAFHMDAETPLADLRQKINGRYAGLEQYTVDVDGLKAFIKRLCKTEGSDEHWFENILMFLGQKPSSKWSDADRSEAEVKLSDYSKRILDLEMLRLHYERTEKRCDGEFDVILLKSLKKGAEPIDEVVAIDKKRHDAIQGVKIELTNALEEYQDKELQLAALAEFVDDFLNKYRAEQLQNRPRKPGRPRKVSNE